MLPGRDRARSVAEGSSASKAIAEAKAQVLDAQASSKHFKEWIRKVPHQVQDLIDVLVAPRLGGSPPMPVRGSGRGFDSQFVPRASQYIATDSLVHSVVYMARYFAGTPDSHHAALLQPQPLMLLFSTCMVLADKFSNDDAYDDLLPAIGIATGIQPKTLRRKEVELLGFLMNMSSMFVSEQEFESVVYLLEENPWRRLKREGTMSMLCTTAREHTSIEELHRQLFTANVRTRTPSALAKPLKAFSDYLRTHRPRPRLPFLDRRTGDKGPGGGRGRSLSMGAGSNGNGDGKAARGTERRTMSGPWPSGAKNLWRVSTGDLRGTDDTKGTRRSLPSLGSGYLSRSLKSSVSAPASPTNNTRRRFDLFGFLARGSSRGSKSSAPSPKSQSPAASPVDRARAAGGARGGSSSLDQGGGADLSTKLPGMPVSRGRDEEAPLPDIREEELSGRATKLPSARPGPAALTQNSSTEPPPRSLAKA